MPIANATDKDDHSYLPPSMRNERVALAKAEQPADTQQPREGEKRPAKQETSNPTDQKTPPKAQPGVGTYLSNLFRRSMKFAFGD